MKKSIILIPVALFIFSCGGNKEQSIEEIIASGNLEEIRAKKTEIVSQQSEYSKQLKQLEKKISELDSNKNIPLITSFIAVQDTFHHYLDLQGNVNTKDLLIIYPEYSGILTTIYVKEGDKVSKGQTIAKIDDGGLNQQLEQMKIQADLAKVTYEKQQRLWDKKIGSEIQYLQVKSNYEAQERVVKQLKERIEKTTVKAPFSGIIDEIITEQGSLVSPGISQLMRIVNLDNMYIETDVPEGHISNVIKNKDVTIHFPVLGKTVNAKIGQVGNYINPANRTFKIEIPISNNEGMIKPNLSAKLRINDYTNEKALLIPQSIISDNADGEQYIYVIKNKKGNIGIAKKAIVTTGQTEGDVIEVLEGIDDGTEMIQEGARSVKDGQEIKIIESK